MNRIRPRRLVSTWLLLSLLWAAASPLLAADYYDEMREKSGKIRPQYQAAHEIHSRMTEAQKKKFLAKSRADFLKDNALDPMPRILTQNEYTELQNAIEQRARTIQMLARDHYSGDKRYLKIIPGHIVDSAIVKTGESGFGPLVNPSKIWFPYGPDIIRTPNGGWAIIEDNLGFIGGPGDLPMAREILNKRQPEYSRVLKPANNPLEYYKKLVRMIRKHAVPKKGAIVLFGAPPYADHEDVRLKNIFKNLGVRYVTPNTKQKLQTDGHGFWLMEGKKRTRVGFVILQAEHRWIDAGETATREQILLEKARYQIEERLVSPKTARKLLQAMRPAGGAAPDFKEIMKLINIRDDFLVKSSRTEAKVPGFLKALKNGLVASNYSPGMDWLGDKSITPHIEKLTKFYFKEEPLIRSIPTRTFFSVKKDGTIAADTRALNQAFKDGKFRKYVFKTVDGRGGSGVWIGPKMSRRSALKLKAEILKNPTAFIAQEFTELSVLDGKIVDLRMISTVSPDGVLISRTPWSRAIPMDGDGKVNLSQEGRELAVIIAPDPPEDCKTAIRKIIKNPGTR